jgi:hypothetical protein
MKTAERGEKIRVGTRRLTVRRHRSQSNPAVSESVHGALAHAIGRGDGGPGGETGAVMVLRRALVIAPLAVLVAMAAHAIGFGGEHLLGGSIASWMLAAGFGGTLLIAGAGLLWLGFTQRDARRGERALRSLLPAGGGIVAAATILGISGSAVFACGEALEGHSPAGTWMTALALGAVAVLVAFAVRACLRWLAAGGAALAALLAWAIAPTEGPVVSVAVERPAAPRLVSRGRHQGRAPPQPA